MEGEIGGRQLTDREASLEILFHESGAGHIEGELAAGVHQYRSMPYRSLSHLSLASELAVVGKAEVTIVGNDNRHRAVVSEMGTRHIVLEIIPALGSSM
jgi:hypothetical protein